MSERAIDVVRYIKAVQDKPHFTITRINGWEIMNPTADYRKAMSLDMIDYGCQLRAALKYLKEKYPTL